jgi:hypothetical protein
MLLLALVGLHHHHAVLLHVLLVLLGLLTLSRVGVHNDRSLGALPLTSTTAVMWRGWWDDFPSRRASLPLRPVGFVNLDEPGGFHVSWWRVLLVQRLRSVRGRGNGAALMGHK